MFDSDSFSGDDGDFEDREMPDSKKTKQEKAQLAKLKKIVTKTMGRNFDWGDNEYGMHEYDLIVDGKPDLGCHENRLDRYTWHGSDKINLSLESERTPGEPATFKLFVENIETQKILSQLEGTVAITDKKIAEIVNLFKSL